MSGKSPIQWTDASWRSIPSWPNYEVTASGDIRNINTRLILTPIRHHRGHLYIFPARGKRLYIHRAVLEAFVGPCPEGYECRHLDGNPANNHLSNLAWGTPSENMQDRRRHGTMQTAEQCGSPLTRAQVVEIKRLLPMMSRRALAARFGVSHTTINKIAQGKRWKEVAA